MTAMMVAFQKFVILAKISLCQIKKNNMDYNLIT